MKKTVKFKQYCEDNNLKYIKENLFHNKLKVFYKERGFLSQKQ